MDDLSGQSRFVTMNGLLWLIAALALAAIELLVPGWIFMGLAASVGLMGVLLLTGLWTAGLPVTLLVTALISAVAWRFAGLWPASQEETRDSDCDE